MIDSYIEEVLMFKKNIIYCGKMTPNVGSYNPARRVAAVTGPDFIPALRIFETASGGHGNRLRQGKVAFGFDIVSAFSAMSDSYTYIRPQLPPKILPQPWGDRISFEGIIGRIQYNFAQSFPDGVLGVTAYYGALDYVPKVFLDEIKGDIPNKSSEL